MSRPFLAVALGLTTIATAPAAAQVSGSYARAVPPDKAAIGRLNLKTEWVVNLPVIGRKDAISQIQTFGDQLFVQTRTSLVIAIDATSGRIQWSAQLGNGTITAAYPLAVNSEYAYVASGTQLYAFHRYTGVVEFSTEMGSPPATGLVADDTGVYCVLEPRRGSGANRLLVYNLPRPIVIVAAAKPVQFDMYGKPIKQSKEVNPIDSLMSRYSPGSTSGSSAAYPAEAQSRPASMEPTGSGMTGSKTPSLNLLPRVTPPYTLANDTSSPSINVLSSFRQPYQLKNDFQKGVQQSPSIGTIPPSVAAALALTDLKPKTVEPPIRWEYGLPSRAEFPLTLTPLRVWVLTDSRSIMALDKVDKKVEAREDLMDPISAPAGRAGLDVYIPLGSGYLVAAEGSLGQLGGGARVLWRTTVGGINNRAPYVTDSMVYAQGDNSGVVCVDRKKGEVVWRSEGPADRILACNQEFIYVRNHQGKVLVFDAKRPTDPVEKLSMPLAGLDLGEFNIPVTNTGSDRLLLAADNGLIVCLRDMSPKYARPMKICPDFAVNPPPPPGTRAAGKDQPPMDPGAKKEPMDPGAKKEPMDPGAKKDVQQ